MNTTMNDIGYLTVTGFGVSEILSILSYIFVNSNIPSGLIMLIVYFISYIYTYCTIHNVSFEKRTQRISKRLTGKLKSELNEHYLLYCDEQICDIEMKISDILKQYYLPISEALKEPLPLPSPTEPEHTDVEYGDISFKEDYDYFHRINTLTLKQLQAFGRMIHCEYRVISGDVEPVYQNPITGSKYYRFYSFRNRNLTVEYSEHDIQLALLRGVVVQTEKPTPPQEPQPTPQEPLPQPQEPLTQPPQEPLPLIQQIPVFVSNQTP